jgi:hypothetical protein
MPRAYSVDMRERVIARSSGALRREAAEQVTISAPKCGDWPLRGQGLRGGSTPLEEHADFLLELIARAYGIDAG